MFKNINSDGQFESTMTDTVVRDSRINFYNGEQLPCFCNYGINSIR